MESTYLVLLLAVVGSSIAAPTFPVPFTGFTPYANTHFAAPRTLPFSPLFSYAYQAEAPAGPIFSQAVPATSFARVIYAEGKAKDVNRDLYRGFAYQTRYVNGGRSEVTFVTGPESKQLMEQNLEFFRSVLQPPPAPMKDGNTNESENSRARPPTAPRITAEAANKFAALLNDVPDTAVYRYRFFPAHTSPLTGNPFSLPTVIDSFYQPLVSPPMTSQEDAKESAGDDNAEAQESMISELRRILSPAESENDISEPQGTSSDPEESNSIADVPTSSSAPNTTQASTSESNSPSTEQVSTDNSVANSNEISSTQTQEASGIQTQEASSTETQETPDMVAGEDTSASTEQANTSTDVPATTSEISSSSEAESETTAAAQSSSSERDETPTSTEATSEETTTQLDDTDLAESA